MTNASLALLTSSQASGFKPAPRYWRANMCGVRVPGAPVVYGGSSDGSLILSWFYDRYDAFWRGKIRDAWQARNYTHVLLSWPDSRAVGATPESFTALCQELVNEGFYVCVFLSSKVYDPNYDGAAVVRNILPVLPPLIDANVLSMACLGWELNLWNNPVDVAILRDTICPLLTPQGTRCYVHFSQGVFAWQENLHTTADFWNVSVGKLTGILFQKDLSWDNAMFQARIQDGLGRFAGGFGFVTDSGFGHPFDYVTLEDTAQDQFNGDMTEAQGDFIGTVGIDTPPVTGPTGVTVGVMGFGNGSLR